MKLFGKHVGNRIADRIGNRIGSAGALRSQGAPRFRGADLRALPVRSVCS